MIGQLFRRTFFSFSFFLFFFFFFFFKVSFVFPLSQGEATCLVLQVIVNYFEKPAILDAISNTSKNSLFGDHRNERMELLFGVLEPFSSCFLEFMKLDYGWQFLTHLVNSTQN